MNKFFFKILILYFVVFISIAGFFTLSDGNTDAFYVRFSSPRQNSLIIGSSRAAQGIVPSVINNELKKIGFNASLFNYAFALGYSSFGPSYYKSIQKKLTPASKDGLFILEVNPWTISDRSETPEDTTNFIEKTLPIGSLKKVSGHPNFDYLINCYD